MHWSQLVSRFHRRKISRRANLQRESRKLAALASHASDGRSRPRRASRSDICQMTCGQDCSNRNEPCSCRNNDQWQVFHWFRYPQTESPSSNRNHSTFSSCAAFACVSPCVSEVACVAVVPLDTLGPSWSVRDSRGFGAERVGVAVCCCLSMPRSRSARLDERVRLRRNGPSKLRQPRRITARSGR